jgi:hypothetical protein
MPTNFDEALPNLTDVSVQVSPGNGYHEPGCASLALLFANGVELQADYWRVINYGRAGTSSFDHQQQYGLPAPIDAIQELRELIQDKVVIDARLDSETGDLIFDFDGNIKLQIFNFTGYEVWEIRFPSGAVEYSNCAK